MDFVKSQKCSVLYYLIVVGYLYSWFIILRKGIVKFYDIFFFDGDYDNEIVIDLDQSVSVGYLLGFILLDLYII